jgi:FAD/FMN-containing dehydrogenase
VEGFIQKILSIVGDDGIVRGAALAERATSYWNNAPMAGLMIIRPRNTAQLSAVMKRCYDVGQAVVTHGGLTGCVDGATVTDKDVIISLERMSAIEEIDSVGRTATVQAGTILQSVQEAVAQHDLYFPLDLGARGSCTIGGNVATNAGGINVLRYGMMREQVLGLEAVLADGTVVSSMNKMLKNNAGYDLKQLFIGTEGTLGIVTRIVLRLREARLSCNCALVALDSFSNVAQLLKNAEKQLGGTLSAYEVMWGEYFDAVTAAGGHRAPMPRHYPFYIILEANGANIDADKKQFMTVLEEAMESGLVLDAVIPKSETERSKIWKIREDFDAIIQPQPTFLYDVSLPIKNMDAYIQEVNSLLLQRWPNNKCYVLGHIGDGNLHLFITPNQAGELLHQQADEDVYIPLAQYGGSISGEHGIGLEKKTWLLQNRSPEEICLMQLLKRTLDPKLLLNPHKIFDV